MEIEEENKIKLEKILTSTALLDFAFPITIQRRSDIAISVAAPDFDIMRAVPLPKDCKSIADFGRKLLLTFYEVDQLAINEFKKRDEQSNKLHRKKLFPRGLKDHLTIDISKLEFSPVVAGKLTTKNERTWQRWCKSGKIKSRCVFEGNQRSHHLIPFTSIEPFIKKELIDNPEYILDLIYF